jgi:hypothetical protein
MGMIACQGKELGVNEMREVNDIHAPFKAIELSRNRGVALVDTADFESLSQYRWFLHSAGYACRAQGTILMHRLIMNAPEGVLIDHRNSNRLDNRKCNLRLATKAQNEMNKPCLASNKLGVKGVVFDRKRNKFVPHIKLNGRQRYLGRFETLREAREAREIAARELFGEFAP